MMKSRSPQEDPGSDKVTPAYRLSSITTSAMTITIKAMPNNVISIEAMMFTLYLPRWDLCALSALQRMLAAKRPEPRRTPAHSVSLRHA